MKKIANTKFNFNTRLTLKYRELESYSSFFSDCIIQLDSGTKFPFSRILLARRSKYFERYFLEHPKVGKEFNICNAVNISIHEIDDESMESFLNLLRNNYIMLTVFNIPKLLRISTLYEFTDLSKALRLFYMDAANDETLLYFASEFIKGGLEHDAKVLAPLIATHLIRIENHDPTEKFTCELIYNALSPSIFSEVLIERNKMRESENQVENLKMYNSNHSSKEVICIRYIEDYVKLKGLDKLNPQDKEELAKVLDWENPISYIYLIEFPCDWLPARYSRPLISIILKKRKLRLKELTRDIKKSEGETSRWFVMSCLRSIHKAATLYEDVPVIECIRTLGGFVPPFNPVKLGLINIKSSKPLIQSYLPENAFISDPQSYFLSKTEGSEMPYIEFYLGPHISFKPKKLFWDSRVCYTNSQLYQKKLKYSQNKGLVQSVDVTVTNRKEEEKIINNFPIPKPDSQDGSQIGIQDCSKLRFTLNGETTAHSSVFRVSLIELIGTFSF